jgi:hypothetical protein
MIYVYNLASSDYDQEFEFSLEVTPEWVVCYAYASEHNLLSLLFSSRTKGLDLSEVFPLVYGKHSVSCGDYVADKRNN